PECQEMKEMSGPGSCSTPEECTKYCQNNPDDPECQEMKEMSGPGSCSTPEECKEYCENNPEDPECDEMFKEMEMEKEEKE
ncbi:MAG: hypothetical protein ACOC6Q_02510, partial [Patescibacteria group bacterium]